MKLEVNTHIHTPYSFSSFESIDQAAALAAKENVRVLGVSDFNTVDGFDEFASACASRRVFPLFNIEFIALLPDDKVAGKRWNDPANPGVMYFCGKALDYPCTFSADTKNRLAALWKGTQDHVWRMIQKVNEILAQQSVAVNLDYNRIRSAYAKNTVRERHVARAVCDGMKAAYQGDAALLTALRALFDDPAFAGDLRDDVSLQNEVRNRLLKAGKPAFVPEDSSAFLSLPHVKRCILDGGGIPSYPVLADDSRPLNEYENDPAALAQTLRDLEVHAVEFIPTRNSLDLLRRYAGYFHELGFCVTFGTEHNTPDLATLVPRARGNAAFDEQLTAISHRGACILAAHQKRRAEGTDGFVDRRGRRLVPPEAMDGFAREGERHIQQTLEHGR